MKNQCAAIYETKQYFNVFLFTKEAKQYFMFAVMIVRNIFWSEIRVSIVLRRYKQ